MKIIAVEFFSPHGGMSRIEAVDKTRGGLLVQPVPDANAFIVSDSSLPQASPPGEKEKGTPIVGRFPNDWGFAMQWEAEEKDFEPAPIVPAADPTDLRAANGLSDRAYLHNELDVPNSGCNCIACQDARAQERTKEAGKFQRTQ